MLYQAYQAQSDMMDPLRKFASMAAETVGAKLNGSARPSGLSTLNAAYEDRARRPDPYAAGLRYRQRHCRQP